MKQEQQANAAADPKVAKADLFLSQLPAAANGYVLEEVAKEARFGKALEDDPDFELSTPMLAMPFAVFKGLGTIPKSTEAWRKQALAKKWLVPFARRNAAGAVEGASGYKAIFLSQTWWERPANATEHDAGAPDYQSGDKKRLKFSMVRRAASPVRLPRMRSRAFFSPHLQPIERPSRAGGQWCPGAHREEWARRGEHRPLVW